MSNIAIRVENLSKIYKIGASRNRHDTLRDHIMHGVTSLFSRNGHPSAISARPSTDRGQSSNSDYIWALQDVSFEVKHGEVIGFIGRNGAGKSTLLKILSRITEPTTGRAEIFGRVGSLLEVGTGFHGELSGRENIYLNGAILGMKKWEIDRKFDEIVAFSEVEKFIDTPVKRYSSGMYVRLAFGVAAHLEPEILIVDEVLAVGDAEFQKKALGKMQEVSQGQGRTVLFVSHNMTAIKKICKMGVLLRNGEIIFSGTSNETIKFYQDESIEVNLKHILFPNSAQFNNEAIQLLELNIGPTKGEVIDVESGISIKLKFLNKKPNTNIAVSFNFYSTDDIHLFEAPCYIATDNNSETAIYEI